VPERLRVVAGSAELEIVRWYLDAAGVASGVSVNVHPAERIFGVDAIAARGRRLPLRSVAGSPATRFGG
jgi:hypothetical protein